MGRLQLLIPLILWAAWLGGPKEARSAALVGAAWGLSIYLLALLAIVFLARRRARVAMDRTYAGFNDSLTRYHTLLFVLRWLLLAVHAAALYLLGWGDLVLWIGSPLPTHHFATVPAVVSVLPVVLAWIGLAWAQYPLDRAVREQNVLWAFDREEPLHAVPSLGAFVSNALRTQVLVTLLPVLAVMLLRDVAHFGLDRSNLLGDTAAGLVTTLVPIALVILFAPELLRRIFPTESLPASPLRDRLEAMCRKLGLRYRDILLWHTHHAVGNAAVMGLVPQVRYVLLSDLILSTMSERQIEAVFAHEAGHVRHHHLTWFVLFTVSFLILLDVLDQATVWLASVYPPPTWLPMDVVVLLAWLTGFFFTLGALSRQFERQADLYAARNVVESDEPSTAAATMQIQPHPMASGADLFNSALIHVARINNMPLDAATYQSRGSWLRNAFGRMVHHVTAWRHGSIRSRIVHLQELAHDAGRTRRFDRRMVALRVALLAGFIATAAWATYGAIQGLG